MMFHMNAAKKILIGIVVVVVLSATALYIRFLNLSVYEWAGDSVVRDGFSYQVSPELLEKYLNGEIKTEGIIGKFKGDKFLGFKTWVVKLNGFDGSEAFLLRGLMFEGAYTRQH